MASITCQKVQQRTILKALERKPLPQDFFGNFSGFNSPLAESRISTHCADVKENPLLSLVMLKTLSTLENLKYSLSSHLLSISIEVPQRDYI